METQTQKANMLDWMAVRSKGRRKWFWRWLNYFEVQIVLHFIILLINLAVFIENIIRLLVDIYFILNFNWACLIEKNWVIIWSWDIWIIQWRFIIFIFIKINYCSLLLINDVLWSFYLHNALSLFSETQFHLLNISILEVP